MLKFFNLYLKLYFNLLKKSFSISGLIVIILLPLILGAIFSGVNNVNSFSAGNRVDEVNLILSMFEFYKGFLLKIEKFLILFDLTKFQIYCIGMIMMGICNYLIIVLFFFILIEIFYFKYRLKGFTTEQIKEIYKKGKFC